MKNNYTRNEEFHRFVEHAGGPKAAGLVLDVTPDMVQKLRNGERTIMVKHLCSMYRCKGFKLSFIKLLHLEH